MQKIKDQILPQVFIPSVLVILIIVLASVFFREQMEVTTGWFRFYLVSKLGWFYILSMSGFLGVTIFLLFSPKGHKRLGPDDSRPEFSLFAWHTMLFSAGMGIGLLFYGVAEPILHYTRPAPPLTDAGSVAAAHNAMGLTFFHWGFHPWACYALVGLALAYFSFRKGLPLSIRSILYPVLGEKIHSWPGHLIDTIAVVSTLFGVATSLGLGAMQINSGLNYVFDTPVSSMVQVIIIALITLAATISVVSGVKKGIRLLSEFNMGLAGIMVLTIAVLGPTAYLANAFVENIGVYLQTLPINSFWTASLEPNRQEWLGSWTVFYWAWWIAWSPFVGMFLARISHGRTVREFLFGVLFVPVLLTLVWFTVFGNSAIFIEQNGLVALADAVSKSIPSALFVFFEAYPIAAILKFVALICIILFFVTSSDSASLVVDIISSGGNVKLDPRLKIFWATTEGLIAAVLLLAGDLAAIQTASITTAFPFTIVLIIASYGMIKVFRDKDSTF